MSSSSRIESDSTPSILPKEPIPRDWITPLVIAILGAAFIGGGSYLLFTGIGTISSVISGSTLIVVGSAALLWGIFRATCQPNPRVAVVNQ